MHHNSPASSSPQQQAPQRDTTTFIYILTATTFFTLFFLISLTTSPTPPSLPPPSPDPHLFPTQLLPLTSSPLPTTSIAYFISGSSGDSSRIFRVLLATYHPKNLYLLHLDRTAPQSDRDSLALKIQSFPVFKAARNVHVIGKADFAYPKGSSPVSSLLRGASILLKLRGNWDWFINLSARDYPLVTQDGIVTVLGLLSLSRSF